VKLSVKTDYACRVLTQLARLYGRGELAHIEQLAQAEAVPANYLVQILGELRNGGLIISRRGKQGGYILARAPREITLLDVVRVIEGDVLAVSASAAGQSGRRVLVAWRELRQAIEVQLAATTLEQLAARGDDGMYYI
jgi:Rrf2 family transcriptional regulator, cysteine metabolism repressor